MADVDPEIPPAQIEAAARAIWEKVTGLQGSWDQLSDAAKFRFQTYAEAALHAAGRVKRRDLNRTPRS